MKDATTIPQARALLDHLQRVDTNALSPDIGEILATIARLVADTGHAIRELDTIIDALRTEAPDRDGAADTLAQAIALRAKFLGHMRLLNPTQAWFWTEEWQAGEREVDRNIASGNMLHFDSDKAFTVYLQAMIPDDAAV